MNSIWIVVIIIIVILLQAKFTKFKFKTKFKTKFMGDNTRLQAKFTKKIKFKTKFKGDTILLRRAKSKYKLFIYSSIKFIIGIFGLIGKNDIIVSYVVFFSINIIKKITLRRRMIYISKR